MLALVFDGKVVDISAKKFPVAPDCTWINCNNDVERGWFYINNSFSQFNETVSDNLARIKIEKINQLSSNYDLSQRIQIKNGHTFIVSLKGEEFKDIQTQVNAADILGSADLIAPDLNGDLIVIKNIPKNTWVLFFKTAKQISVNNLALKMQNIIAINKCDSLLSLEAININPFPSIQTIILEI